MSHSYDVAPRIPFCLVFLPLKIESNKIEACLAEGKPFISHINSECLLPLLYELITVFM